MRLSVPQGPRTYRRCGGRLKTERKTNLPGLYPLRVPPSVAAQVQSEPTGEGAAALSFLRQMWLQTEKHFERRERAIKVVSVMGGVLLFVVGVSFPAVFKWLVWTTAAACLIGAFRVSTYVTTTTHRVSAMAEEAVRFLALGEVPARSGKGEVEAPIEVAGTTCVVLPRYDWSFARLAAFCPSDEMLRWSLHRANAAQGIAKGSADATGLAWGTIWLAALGLVFLLVVGGETYCWLGLAIALYVMAEAVRQALTTAGALRTVRLEEWRRVAATFGLHYAVRSYIEHSVKTGRMNVDSLPDAMFERSWVSSAKGAGQQS